VIRPIFDDVLVQLQTGDDSFAPVVTAVIRKSATSLSEEHLARYMSDIFPLLCELVSVNSPEVRRGVQEVLVSRISPLVSQLPTQALLAAAAASGRGPVDGAPDGSPGGRQQERRRG